MVTSAWIERPEGNFGTLGLACLKIEWVMADIEDFRRLVAGDHGLVVVSVSRGDGTISSWS
jgi:hypothetical protein